MGDKLLVLLRKMLFRGKTLLVIENYNLAVCVPLTAIPNRESRGTRPPCESRAAPSSPPGDTLRTKCGTLRAGTQSLRA